MTKVFRKMKIKNIALIREIFSNSSDFLMVKKLFFMIFNDLLFNVK